MSNAMSVAHGEFGRAAIYALDRPIVTHAHREGHLIFHVEGEPATMTVGEETFLNDKNTIVAVSPWESHSFQNADGGQSFNLVLYIKPMWFLENNNSAEFALKFGTPKIKMTPTIQKLVTRLTTLLLHDEVTNAFDGLLFSLTLACFETCLLYTSDAADD